jgi:hypothetical protein
MKTKSLDQIRREGGGRVDRAKMDRTSDADIKRQIAEDTDTAPDMSTWDLSKARVVRPLRKKVTV